MAGLLTPRWLGQETGHSERFPEKLRRYGELEVVMLKAMTVVLNETELHELYRILLDEDASGALAFLRTHFRDKIRAAMEGG